MVNRNGQTGRPNKPTFVTSWGERIEGVYLGKDGKLRPHGLPRPAYSIADEKLGVSRMKRYLARQNPPKTFTVDEWAKLSPLEAQRVVSQQNADSHSTELPTTYTIDPRVENYLLSLERERLRDLILTDPKQAAIELKIPHLAEYPETRVTPSLTLKQLADDYYAKATNAYGKKLSRRNVSNSRIQWREFLDVVKVEYARDLSKQHFLDYLNHLESSSIAVVTRNNRITTVKKILNWGLKKTIDTADYRKAVDISNGTLEKKKEAKAKKTRITREQFHKLLAESDTRMKAALLLGMNAAMHGGEITATRKSHIDFEKKTLIAPRPKTGVMRYVKLWDRTIEAINALNSKSDFLFVSKSGRQLTGENLRQQFVAIRKRSGVDVSLEGLRDTAYSIATQTDSYYARYIAGHVNKRAVGEQSEYVFEEVNDNVVKCCKAIEDHFFS